MGISLFKKKWIADERDVRRETEGPDYLLFAPDRFPEGERGDEGSLDIYISPNVRFRQCA